VLSHVTGFVLQESGDHGADEPDAAGLAVLARRFPLTFAAAAHGWSDDELFERSVDLLCAGIATLVEG
jgi:TetR/AcrR family tetracycline transcriptional repressor